MFGIVALSAQPALADHVGPSGVGTSGLAVFGPDTLDEGHWAAGLRLLYTKPEQRSDLELEALAAQGIDAHNTNYNFNGSIGLAYGITHELSVSAELPYVRRDDLRVAEDGEVSQLGSVSGIGDLSLLAKYRLTHGGSSGFALIAGIKMPTGSTSRRGANGERLETEHQPGSGSWDPVVGASTATSFGTLRLTASALFQISTMGAQDTRLGNRLQAGIALSHRFGGGAQEHYEAVRNHHHGDELDEHSGEPPHSSWDTFVELGGEWEGRQKIGDEVERESGGKWAYIAPGVRFNSREGWSAGAAFALPVWQQIRASHPDNRYRFMLSLGRAF
jgi:hypothetical protein